MNRLTRKTTKEDYERKAKSYWMGEDESTSEQFIEKFPYTITKGFRFHSFNEYLNKLGVLEDLEEQLGCPLEVVFQALIEGAYFKNLQTQQIDFFYNIDIDLHYDDLYTPGITSTIKDYWSNDELYFSVNKSDYFVKDYGKTWFLKGEKCD